MKVAVGSDHRGFDAKQQIKSIITQMGHECLDFGTDGTHPVDYPDLAYVVATAVSRQEADRAILICATGLGMSIAANKVRGIRAALCHDELSAHVSRHENQARASPQHGHGSSELPEGFDESESSREFGEGRALPSGHDEAVEPFQLVCETHLDRIDAQTSQHCRVFYERPLQGQHSDFQFRFTILGWPGGRFPAAP